MNEETAEGFTGSISALLEWLDEHLQYGSVSVTGPVPSELDETRMVHEIRTVTGGFSDDEELLGRLSDSVFGLRFWNATFRGGLTTYEIPVAHWETDMEFTWLNPATDVMQTLYRVRQVVVEDLDGSSVTVGLPRGAQLRITEPTDENGVRNFGEPDAVLRLSPIPVEEFDEVFDLLAPRD